MKNLPTSLDDDALLEATTTGSFVAVAARPPGKFELSSDYEISDDEYLLQAIPDRSERPGPPWLVGPREFAPQGPQHFEPLAVPDLHRRFARVKETPTDLLRFANKYGFLGLTAPVESTDAEDYDPGCFIAESAADWRYECRVMAHLVELYDLAQKGAAGPLTKMVHWQTDKRLGLSVSISWPVDNPDGLLTVASKRDAPHLLGRWREGALAEPARYALNKVLNGYLDGHVSPLLLPFERRGDIVFRADNLLAAMYMQFALEISGKGRRPKLCKGCGTYFTPKRSNQDYCEPNCKNRAFYKRKTQNRQ